MNLSYLQGSPKATFLIGGLGAGKTELALNLAVWNAKNCKNSNLIDLDIVNPFFRVRKLKKEVEEQGVHIIMPDSRVASGDIPGLPAELFGAIQNPENTLVCDVGGGEPGLRPLGRLKEIIEARNANVFFVLNPYRPGFTSIEETLESYKNFCRLSSLSVTQIVANPNLSGETSLEIFMEGMETIKEFSKEVGLPIAFCMADLNLASEISGKELNERCFIETEKEILFAIERFWSVPWHFGVE